MDRHPTLPAPKLAAPAVLAAMLAAAPGLAATPPETARGTAAPARPQLTAAAGQDDGPVYRVGSIEIRYLRENALQPPIEQAMEIPLTLGRTASGYVAPREGLASVTTRASEIGRQPAAPFHASAIQHILETLRDHFVARDLLGVYVAPDPAQISAVGEDLRAAGDRSLKIIVTTAIVTELRTIASGERVGEGRDIDPRQRVNNPRHRRIAERSPVRPYSEGDPERHDLLRKSELDRYLFHLGRHPGRRVDASVAAAQDVGGIALDYMITENNPLVLYFQVSNTGTRSTDRVRERFGLVDNQLTNNDDVLSLDYSTAGFDEVHAFVGSYEAPLPNDRIRWRVFGSWSQYTATDVGFFRDVFKGQSYSVGGEITANVYQNRELFLDLTGGVRFENVQVDNRVFGINGDESFLFPYLGLRLDRTTEWFSTRGALTLEFQAGDLTDTDEAELVRLGRTAPDRDWAVLRYDLAHSVFLEPLLDRAAWEDPTTPRSSTLAHELRFALHGQYAFGNRLIPQQQFVAGGLYTVRGYPQSVVAGDSAVIGTVEYRLHVPHIFAIQPEPGTLFGQPFRAAPQYVYGSPDWDLVLKGFLDAGAVFASDKLFFESDETLVGAGIGAELLFRRNLNVRVDWGFVLNAIDERDVNSGSNRVQFVATILF